MCKHTASLACTVAALWSATILATPAHAAEQQPASPAVLPDRLSFPEPATLSPRKVLPAPAAPQEAVALPTPQFTGFTAVAVLTGLLCCRKSILRLVS
jgi:hypothetical protein